MMQVPCGQCIGCRIDKSRHWAIRCVHEAQMHQQNSFITLTYEKDEEAISLNSRHFSRFMKRLRKTYEPEQIRFYHCGEYGTARDDEDQPIPHPLVEKRTALGRAHHHAILFGIDFSDKQFFSQRKDIITYTSPTLERIWRQDKNHSGGFITLGDVNVNTAAYVARYCMKKLGGELGELYYSKVDKHGELIRVKPEFTTMSRRQGIGYSWFEKYANDLFPWDEAIHDGKKYSVPKYYLTLLEREAPTMYQDLKEERRRKFAKHAADNTPQRLAAKEKVKQRQLQSLKRTLQ